MSRWIIGKVVSVKHWTNRLFSLIVHASIDKFVAGQFTRLGIVLDGVFVQRAYSYLNAPNDPNLEFYINVVRGGKLTPILYNLDVGDSVMLTKQSYGYFILDKIPDCENLWMLATGTGIAPFLSILTSNMERLNTFSKIILVCATQFLHNLNYLSTMQKLKKIYCDKLYIQTVLSQEMCSCALYGRISDLLENNSLEKEVNLKLDVHTSHVMLCGNPIMIRDTKEILNRKYGMTEHLKCHSGNITQERYW